MDDRAYVLSKYPTAKCEYNPDKNRFKVYYTIGESQRTWTMIALSNSWESESMAWFEAASELKKKETVPA